MKKTLEEKWEEFGEAIDDQIRLIEELEEENTQLKKERDEFLERKLLYQQSFKRYEEIIKDTEEERNVLKHRIIMLEQQLADKAEEEEVKQIIEEDHSQRATCERETKTEEKKQSTILSDSGISMTSQSVNEKIKKTSVSEFKKVTQKPNHRTSHRSVLHERESNMIIHGMIEDSSISDTDKVWDILDAIQAKNEPVTMFRLGKKEEGKNRPILVRLNSKEEKNKVFSKLGRLKHATRRYNERISITHDYKREERRKLKDLVEEAKRRNNKATKGCIWKVRGMEIIKLPLRAQKEDTTEHFIEAHESWRS